MLELITDLERIKGEPGIDLEEWVGEQLDFDSANSAAPILLKNNEGESFLLVRHIKRGSHPELKVRNAKVLYYKPYFSISNTLRNQSVPPDWIDLLNMYFPDDKDITVYSDISMERYWPLAKSFNVILETSKGMRLEPEQLESFDLKLFDGVGDAVWKQAFVYTISKNEVISSFAQDRDVFISKAEQLCKELNDGDKIRAWLKKEDSRFLLLDEILNEQGLEVLFLSSPFNVQEISSLGIFMENRPDMFAVHRRGDPNVYIIARQEIDEKPFVPITKYSNQREAYEAIVHGESIGVDKHLPMEQYMALGLERGRVKGVSDALQLWREKRAGEELSYYLIVLHATRHVIEGALDYAKTSIEAGHIITELDVEAKLNSLLSEYEQKQNLPASLKFYFLGLRTGDRSSFPSPPVNYVLTKSVKTFCIDHGRLLIDLKGRLRAASDIARAITFTAEGRELHELLVKIIAEDTPRSLVPGIPAKEVYFHCMKSLEPHTGRLKDIGMMPALFELTNFTRDVGHTLGKQEPAYTVFNSGNYSELTAGMVCCLELQWSFNDNFIAIENEFLVTEQGALNLTL